jgi:hypothetical protein
MITVMLHCSPPGRVLHVDNKESVPYTAEDGKLRQRVVHALVKHRLITNEQQYSCRVNILLLGRRYMVEVWPDAATPECRFGVALSKLLLKPVKRYIDCRNMPTADTATRASQNYPKK